MTEQEKNKKTAKNAMTFSGVGFTALGAWGLSSPQAMQEFLEMDLFDLQLFCGLCIVVGITSVIVAQIIFKVDNRK